MNRPLRHFVFGNPECEPVVRASCYVPPEGAVEAHLCVLPGPGGTDFSEQLLELTGAYESALRALDLPAQSVLFRRFFLSDTANQEEALLASPLARSTPANPLAVSVVEQPPLPEGRIALWAWHLHDRGKGPVKHGRPGGLLLVRPHDRHLLATDLACDPAGGPACQTRALFERFGELLAEQAANLRQHAVRTWLFVHSVDLNYAEMVSERAALFEEAGLTTHYIASTGIEGRRRDPRSLVQLEAYALPDLTPDRIRYLSAPACLGPTSAYGVTFERGTRIAYGDRSHLFISGTASIDNQGRIVHPGDIEGQTARTFANIAGLLADGGAKLTDTVQMIVLSS